MRLADPRRNAIAAAFSSSGNVRMLMMRQGRKEIKRTVRFFKKFEGKVMEECRGNWKWKERKKGSKKGVRRWLPGEALAVSA